jgi:choline dehydrogenase-like flavoprotein
MLLDTAGAERAAFAERDFDVCVIGSGPAGMTLARRLAARGRDVALMEAGGLEWSPESQDVYHGEITGHHSPDLDGVRLRFFGGTSFHWGGQSREFDEGDFAPRAHHPLSGWPIAKADLDPYGPETAEILDLPGSDFPDLPRPEGSPFRQLSYMFSPPTQFGAKYLDEITASRRILCGLHANLVDLRLVEPDLSRVEAAVFRSYDPGDPGFAVRARVYALCTGGIENPRLLLNFTSQKPAGIGNEHGLVGRYFMDHPNAQAGEVIYAIAEEPVRYVPTEAFMAEQGTLAMLLATSPRERREMDLLTEAARDLQCMLPFGERLVEAVLRQKPGRCDTGGIAEWWRSRDPERHPWGRVYSQSEQALNPDSFVGLSEARDAFGLRRARLHWALQPIDYHTMQTTTLALAQDIARRGIGRMRVYDWVLEGALPAVEDGIGQISSYHHMCTTRMSDDPRHGVVDRNCRVHDCGNLYIGGSSVFATGSYAHPTYTIVQLALRLGDHLDRELDRIGSDLSEGQD